MSRRIIIGLGTGRCGTHSLATLLNRQPRTSVSHEARPLLPWSADACQSQVRRRLRKMLAACSDADRVGEVALFYLPYAAQILETCRSAVCICLWRPKDQVVVSYARWIRRNYGPDVDHWRADRRGLRPRPWDRCYPKYEVATLEQGIACYWEEYQRQAADLAQRFAPRFELFEMHEALNTNGGIRRLLSFAGVAPQEQVVCQMHECRSQP